MKRFFLFLAMLCITWQVAANHHHANKLSIISEEIVPSETTFTLKYYLKTTEETHIQAHRLKLPPGVTEVSASLPKSVIAGDSVVFTIHLTYDKNHVSFFARTIGLQLELANGEQLRNDAKLYFTPWGTVEALSHPDFYGGPTRRWFGTQAIADSIRIPLDKADIPVSDVDFNTTERQEVKWVTVPGLAYELLMTKDKAEYYATLPGDDQQPPTNARVAFTCSSKVGRVKGRLMHREINDLGVPVEFPLQYIHVRLRDDDNFLDDQLGETYTNEQGYFDITYQTCQSFEGDLELFLEFVAKSPDYGLGKNIQAYSSPININIFNMDGNQIQARINLGKAGDGYYNDKGNIYLEDNSFVTVHRAFQAYLFSQPHLSQEKGLDIIMYQNYGASFHLPDRLLLSTATPKIFLIDGAEVREGTIYHEYGHHVFYLAAGYDPLPLYDNKDGDHDNNRDNHPYGAFNEGWADAFHYIMDAHRFMEDHEYGFEKGGVIPEHEEIRRILVQTADGYNYTNGLKSEYLIGTALYDLWDGADKGLPKVASFARSGTNPIVTFPGFQDVVTSDGSVNGTWSPGNEDDVSLSFAQIIKGLKDNPTNVHDFFRNLVIQNGFASKGCNTQLSAIEKVFRNNWVVHDIPAYRAGLGGQLTFYPGNFVQLHSEYNYGYVPTVSRAWFVGGIFEWSQGLHYYSLDYNWGEQNTISPGDFLTVNSSYERINQPLLIDRQDHENFTRTLSFTGAVDYELCNNLSITVSQGVLDLQNQGQFIISQKAILETTQSSSAINVGANTQLVIYDRGILRLTARNSRVNLHGELHIYPGGTLSIDGSDAGINVLGNGKIIIHPGAYICVNGVVHMSFSKTMAEQLHFSTYNLGVHPDWQNQFGDGTCRRFSEALGSNLGLTLSRTNQITCNNTNFGYQITGPQLPGDAQICWYFPSTWSSWVTSQNCTPWVTNASGTTNNWQQGNYQGGEVIVIVKANGKIQELRDVVSSAVVPQLTLIEPTEFNGTLSLCHSNRLVVEASGGNSPYQFDWKNHWNLNYGLYNQSTKSTLTLNPEQWVFDVQTFQVSAKDAQGCKTNEVQMSVSPSENIGWIPRPLNFPEELMQKTGASLGLINNDFALSKYDESIFFTDQNNALRFYIFDNSKLKWVLSDVLVNNSAGSVELFENNNEKVVYYKNTSNQLQSVRFDKVLREWQAPVVYSTATDVQSHVFVTDNKEVFYRNTSNQLIQLLPNNLKKTLALNIAGVNFLQIDEKLFHVNSSGNVNYVNIITGQQYPYLGSNAKNVTALKSDSKKNVFYVNNSGNFQMIPYNGNSYSAATTLIYKQAPSTAWNLANGYFDINKISGVIYYIGVNDRIYQLHKQPSGVWKSQLPADDRDFVKKSHITYRYPHAYYIAGEYIHNLFYAGEDGCIVLQREGEGDFNLDELSSFSIYPNPTQSSVSIQLKDIESKGTFELISGIGEVVLSLPISTTYLEWDLESINSGLYLVVLKDIEGKIIQSEKLMILE